MSWWTERQKNDPYVKLRDKKNYISRAYFKIEEIQERFQIITQDAFILDLGAAPGGWSQFFVKFSPNVFAVDILNNFQIKKAKFICGDINDDNVFQDFPTFDVICSDIAPNLSGHKFVDQMKSINLCHRSLEICLQKLKRHGHFVTKIFEGEGFGEFISRCKDHFKYTKIFKPHSSRNESNERFLICEYLINS